MPFRMILLEYKIKVIWQSAEKIVLVVAFVAGGAGVGASLMHSWDVKTQSNEISQFRTVIGDERDAQAKRFTDELDKLSTANLQASRAFDAAVKAKDAQIATLTDLTRGQNQVINDTAKVSANAAVAATKALRNSTAAVETAKQAAITATTEAKRPAPTVQTDQLKNAVRATNSKVKQ